MRAVVVSFDRLPLAFLGCHGNTWVDTPHFDRLAAESIVFERCFAENADTSAAGHAWWTGCRQFPAEPGRVRGGSVPAVLTAGGVRTVLLVEEPGTRPSTPLPEGFGESVSVRGADGLDVSADETPFAKLVAEATRRLRGDLAEEGGSWLLWLKSRGVPSPWLAPRDHAITYVPLFEDTGEEWVEEDEDGHPTITSASATDDVPAAEDEDFEWDADADDEADDDEEYDPDFVEYDDRTFDELDPEEQAEYDELVTILAGIGRRQDNSDLELADWLLSRAIYAGYVSLLDESLGRLRTAISEAVGEDVLLIVTGALGESLGERADAPASEQADSVQEEVAAVGEELVHVPLFVRVPDGTMGTRRRVLVQDVDIPCTLLDAFGLSPDLPLEGVSLVPRIRDDANDDRSAVVTGGTRGTVSLRTDEFLLVETGDPDGRPRLFVEPDDVWQTHDVAAMEPDVVERYGEELRRFVDATSSTIPVSVEFSKPVPEDG